MSATLFNTDTYMSATPLIHSHALYIIYDCMKMYKVCCTHIFLSIGRCCTLICGNSEKCCNLILEKCCNLALTSSVVSSIIFLSKSCLCSSFICSRSSFLCGALPTANPHRRQIDAKSFILKISNSRKKNSIEEILLRKFLGTLYWLQSIMISLVFSPISRDFE